jgi:hypothetical protein
MDNKEFNLKQFDLVKLKTTKNVKFLTAPDDKEVSPHGAWSVIGVFDKTDALLCKEGATCRIPIEDIIKIAEYHSAITTIMESKRNGKEEKR